MIFTVAVLLPFLALMLRVRVLQGILCRERDPLRLAI